MRAYKPGRLVRCASRIDRATRLEVLGILAMTATCIAVDMLVNYYTNR